MAQSKISLDKQIAAISAFLGGETHTLSTKAGLLFDNLRMDVFKFSNERTSGVGVAVDYEIVYTQLV